MAIQQLNSVQAQFPKRLTHLHTPPSSIYIRGHLTVEKPLVAIIGSRRPSSYGLSVTNELATSLAGRGVGIVSGLALGIDAAAHSAALAANGYTIAVLANGLDTISPRQNTQLGESIVKAGGALVSEYAPGSKVYRNNFIERNRIIAALADVIIVVEAAERSGTMSTARFGLELGRNIMAVPGSIQSVLSKGTHNLIKAGAAPLTEVEDVFEILGIEHASDSKPPIAATSKLEEIIILALQNGTHNASEILANVPVSSQEFLSTLTALEIRGVIHPGGNNTWYLRSSKYTK